MVITITMQGSPHSGHGCRRFNECGWACRGSSATMGPEGSSGNDRRATGVVSFHGAARVPPTDTLRTPSSTHTVASHQNCRILQ